MQTSTNPETNPEPTPETNPGPAAEPVDGEQPASEPAKASVLHRLYTGTGAFGIVERRRTWYLLTAVLVAACIVSIAVRGFSFGIEFEGGTQVRLPAVGAAGPITTEEVAEVYTETLGHPPASVQSVQVVGSGAESVLLRSETLTEQQILALRNALFEQLAPLGAGGDPTLNAISSSTVSGTWGSAITQQAIIALVVFLALVAVFLAIYFEPRMAAAALAALLFDLVVTMGVYSMVGFLVTPATVIGLLTILGFSLYDTVVVFDKIKENTRGLLGLTRRTYGEAANLALNQTLMRSINTSLIAVLPVVSLLAVGAGLLGVGTLKDLALVLMIGMAWGAFSSIFLATPIAVDLTMRRADYRQQAERVAARRANRARKAEQTQTGEGAAAAASALPEAAPAGAGRIGGVPDRVGKQGPPRRSRSRGSGSKPRRPSGKKQR